MQDSISKAGEIDYFVLPLDTSGIISISLDAVPGDMRPRITVTNEYTGLWADSAAMADKTATNSGDSLTLEKALFGPSSYWIAVIDADGKAQSDPHTLTFAFEPAPDSNEPNEEIGDAAEVKLDQIITAYICPVNDEDFYKFYVNGQQIVSIRLDGVPADMKGELALYDKGFGYMTSSAAANLGDSVSLEKDLQGPGWFFIKVRDANGKAHSEPYSMTIGSCTGA